MEGILKIAGDNGVQELILGNWGCGAFGNDRKTFLKLWNTAIKKTKCVPSIVFAFLDEVDLFPMYTLRKNLLFG